MSGYAIEIAFKPKKLFGRRKLAEAECEALASAIQELVHDYLGHKLVLPAEKKVLDVLDDVVDYECKGDSAGTISFSFQEHWTLGAVCGRHWYAYAIAACWDELDALFAERAQKVAGRRPALAKEFGPLPSYALALWDDNILAVNANGDAIFSGGKKEDAVLTYDSELLDSDSRLLAKQLYDTGLCQCSLCTKARPASVAGKAAELRRPKEPELPVWLLAMRAAERGDVVALDRLIAGDEYAVERSFEAGVKSPGAISIKHLISRGHHPSAVAVANAARLNAVEALQLMSASGADLESHDEIGRPPLANAAMYGCIEAVRFLLQAGVNVNAQALHSGETALLLAFSSENQKPEAIIGMLVAAGANVEAKDHDGRGVEAFLGRIADEARRAEFSRGLQKA